MTISNYGPYGPIKFDNNKIANEIKSLQNNEIDIDRNLREDLYEHGKFCESVDIVLKELGDMLKAKNLRYGNSALHPVRVFSKADVTEQIKVRMDDKISRLIRGNGTETEDPYTDLTGYLILLKIAEKDLI